MDKTKALNDLRRFCWPITAHNRGYAQSLLASLGHSPQFPYPPFLSLWLPYTVATVLGEDTSKWAEALSKETDRQEKIKADFDKETAKTKAEIAAINARRRAILSAQSEIDEALGHRLGY